MGILHSASVAGRDNLFRPFAFPIPSVSYDKTLPGLRFIDGIPIIYLRTYPNRPTILFSHGNGCDLGHTYYLILELAEKLQVNILAYDYPGYGLSDGSPSESSCYITIQKVYEYLLRSVDRSSVILMGQSVGTGPTCWLASILKKDSYRQIILISGFTSAIAVASPNSAKITFTSQIVTGKSFDIFSNYYHLKMVTGKVDYLHGIIDNLIPITQSYQMANVTGTVHPIPGANHNSIMSDDLPASLRVLKKIIG